MVLAGITVLFGIVASTPAYWDLFHAKLWTYAGIRETFLGVILLGMLLGWFFPVKVKKYCPAFVVVPAIILFLLANAYLVIGEHKPTPQEVKLADCSGNIANIHLVAPKGRHYVLDLKGVPLGHMTNGSYISSYQFTGHLWIRSNSQTNDIPLDSDKMFAFPGGLVLSPISLTGGKQYDLRLEFNPPPPPSSFISLYWMQIQADRKE